MATEPDRGTREAAVRLQNRVLELARQADDLELERDRLRAQLTTAHDALREIGEADSLSVVKAICANGPLGTAPGGPREDECSRLRVEVEALKEARENANAATLRVEHERDYNADEVRRLVLQYAEDIAPLRAENEALKHEQQWRACGSDNGVSAPDADSWHTEIGAARADLRDKEFAVPSYEELWIETRWVSAAERVEPAPSDEVTR